MLLDFSRSLWNELPARHEKWMGSMVLESLLYRRVSEGADGERLSKTGRCPWLRWNRKVR